MLDTTYLLQELLSLRQEHKAWYLALVEAIHTDRSFSMVPTNYFRGRVLDTLA